MEYPQGNCFLIERGRDRVIVVQGLVDGKDGQPQISADDRDLGEKIVMAGGESFFLLKGESAKLNLVGGGGLPAFGGGGGGLEGNLQRQEKEGNQKKINFITFITVINVIKQQCYGQSNRDFFGVVGEEGRNHR